MKCPWRKTSNRRKQGQKPNVLGQDRTSDDELSSTPVTAQCETNEPKSIQVLIQQKVWSPNLRRIFIRPIHGGGGGLKTYSQGHNLLIRPSSTHLHMSNFKKMANRKKACFKREGGLFLLKRPVFRDRTSTPLPTTRHYQKKVNVSMADWIFHRKKMKCLVIIIII